MAIWQYTAYLIPTTTVAGDGTMIGLKLTKDSFALPPLVFNLPPTEVERLIAEYLPPCESWHKDLHKWGDVDGDDVDAWYENGQLREIRVRLDLRKIDAERISKLVKLARSIDSCFLDGRTFEVIPADEALLRAAINRSVSAKYVADPRGYLESLP